MTLTKDPINLLIAGVGGQGNVRMAEIVGSALLQSDYLVSIGDVLGGAQRGGSVASHIRISKETRYGPYIPEGQADIIVGMEPVETLRVVTKYGNPGTMTITSTRPISSVDIFGRRVNYPDLDLVFSSIREMSSKVWIIDAMGEALKLGKPIYANMILIGALIGTGLLPFNIKSMEPILIEAFGNEADTKNMSVLRKGIDLVKQ